MDGENNGKPYEQMDDLGVFPLFLEGHPNRPRVNQYSSWEDQIQTTQVKPLWVLCLQKCI